MRHFIGLPLVTLIVILSTLGVHAQQPRSSRRVNLDPPTVLVPDDSAEAMQNEPSSQDPPAALPTPIKEYRSGAFEQLLHPIPADTDSPSTVPQSVATNRQDDSGEEPLLRLAQRPIQAFQLEPATPHLEQLPPVTRASDETSVARPHLLVEARMPSEINAGSVLSCELLVRNTGETRVDGVVLVATLPKIAKLIDTQPTGETLDNGNVRFSLGSMAGGEQRRVVVNLLPNEPGTLYVDALVTFEISTREVVLVRQPELSLSVSLPRQMVFGRQSVIRMTVTNIGDAAASDVGVQALFPAESIETEGNENVVLGTLRPGESREIDLVWTPRDFEPVPVEFIASGAGGLRAAANTVITITCPNLEISASGPTSFYLDTAATYSIFVSNPGTAEANEIVVAIQIPEGLKIRAIERYADYDAESRTLLWRIPRLDAGATEVFRMMAEADSEGQHIFLIDAHCDSGIQDNIQYETQSRSRDEVVMDDVDTGQSDSVGETGTAQNVGAPLTR